MSKVVPLEERGCWEYRGSLSWAGYGLFWFDGKYVMAHRFSYEMLKGEIARGLEIDHLCFNPCCVNPDHLEAVTHKVNKRRAMKKYCKQGHPFSSENTYMDKRGQRDCILCRYTRTRQWKIRHDSRT